MNFRNKCGKKAKIGQQWGPKYVCKKNGEIESSSMRL